MKTPNNLREKQPNPAARCNYFAGISAEDCVVRAYLSQGYQLEAQRWRGKSGEIDLIFRHAPGVVFVEVKKSKSHERASAALSQAQIKRIMTAAQEYMAEATSDPLCDLRFDAALVDATGALRIHENAFAWY
ncbi:MAG: YraN family protein [Pseudomonadota bacterium]